MKYPAIFLLAILFFLAGCAKETLNHDKTVSQQSVDARNSDLVDICHSTGNGQFVPIQVNQNAVAAHLAHGDYLPDADGDGYSATGACSGSMNDCDDNNANVNPGASEVCGNGIDDDCDGLTDGDDSDCNSACEVTEEYLNSASEFVTYYNADENNCLEDEFPIDLALETDLYVIYAVENEFVQGFAFLDFASGTECVGVVGENITEEQYQAIIDLVNGVIASHPEMPNYCDVYPPLQGNRKQVTTTVQPEKLLGSLKNTFPTRFLQQPRKK